MLWRLQVAWWLRRQDNLDRETLDTSGGDAGNDRTATGSQVMSTAGSLITTKRAVVRRELWAGDV